MRELQVNAADEIRIFMVSSSDHITPVTGATVAVSLLKKGQTAFAAGAGTVTEAGGGWYIYYATAADTNTFGPLAVRAVATGCDAFNTEYQVKYANPYVKSTVKADEFGTDLNLTTNMANEVASRCVLALYSYGAATASALAAVDTIVDAILVDTGTTIPAQITGLNDTTAQEVWEYATRALTDKTDFVLSSAGVSTVQSGLATASQLTEVQKYVEADIVIDTTTTPYKMIIKQKGTETVLGTKELYDVNGDPIDSLTTFWGQQKEA